MSHTEDRLPQYVTEGIYAAVSALVRVEISEEDDTNAAALSAPA
jgi:hypothetical protein